MAAVTRLSKSRRRLISSFEKTNPFAEVDQLPILGGFRHTGIGGAMGFWELPAVSGEDDGRCYALIEVEAAADFVV